LPRVYAANRAIRRKSSFRHGLRFINVYQSLIGAIGDTDRYFLPLAQVAFKHFLLFLIELEHTHGANQHTGTTADTPFIVDGNHAGLGIPGQCPGQASTHTGGIVAVLAAYRQGDDAVFLDAETGHGPGRFFLENLNQVIGPGVMELAVNLTEVAADTDLFINIDLFHENPS
jgi:hypothetical protein